MTDNAAAAPMGDDTTAIIIVPAAIYDLLLALVKVAPAGFIVQEHPRKYIIDTNAADDLIKLENLSKITALVDKFRQWREAVATLADDVCTEFWIDGRYRLDTLDKVISNLIKQAISHDSLRVVKHLWCINHKCGADCYTPPCSKGCCDAQFCSNLRKLDTFLAGSISHKFAKITAWLLARPGSKAVPLVKALHEVMHSGGGPGLTHKLLLNSLFELTSEEVVDVGAHCYKTNNVEALKLLAGRAWWYPTAIIENITHRKWFKTAALYLLCHANDAPDLSLLMQGAVLQCDLNAIRALLALPGGRWALLSSWCMGTGVPKKLHRWLIRHTGKDIQTILWEMPEMHDDGYMAFMDSICAVRCRLSKHTHDCCYNSNEPALIPTSLSIAILNEYGPPLWPLLACALGITCDCGSVSGCTIDCTCKAPAGGPDYKKEILSMIASIIIQPDLPPPLRFRYTDILRTLTQLAEEGYH